MSLSSLAWISSCWLTAARAFGFKWDISLEGKEEDTPMRGESLKVPIAGLIEPSSFIVEISEIILSCMASSVWHMIVLRFSFSAWTSLKNLSVED